MERLIIRKMTTEDVPIVQEIEAESHATPWTLRLFMHELVNGSAEMSVAVLDDRVIGYVCIRALLDEVQLLNLAVERSYRRQGVATRLLRAALTSERCRSAKKIMLEVRASNSGAIGLYMKAGFQIAGRRKDYYQKPREDGIQMNLTVIKTADNAIP